MKTSLKAGTPLQRRPLLGIILVGLLGTFGGASERSDAPQSPAAHQVPPSQGSEGGYQEGLVTSVEPGSSFTLRFRSGHSQTFKVDAGTRTHALTRWGAESPSGLQVGQRARVSSTIGVGGVPLATRITYATAPRGDCAPHPRGPKEPLARIYHQAAYRPHSDEMFVFSGQSQPSWTNDVLDMWSYQVGADRWHYLGEQPVVNYDAVAYDASADRIVIYNPFDADGNGLATPETWAFDPVTRHWENRQALNPPPARWGSMMVYDAHIRKSVLFAGGDMNTWLPLNDTWTYDYPTNSWVQLQTSLSPPALNYGAIAYDGLAKCVVLFSGNCWNEDGLSWNLKETWTLDAAAASWKEVPTTSSPEARTYHRMVFDPHLGALLMFGGCTGTDVAEDPLVPQNDAWVFNARSSTWHQLSPRNAPSPRGWHSMVYATQSGRAVVFGGGASRETPTHEAWIYISRLNGWKNTLD